MLQAYGLGCFWALLSLTNRANVSVTNCSWNERYVCLISTAKCQLAILIHSLAIIYIDWFANVPKQSRPEATRNWSKRKYHYVEHTNDVKAPMCQMRIRFCIMCLIDLVNEVRRSPYSISTLDLSEHGIYPVGKGHGTKCIHHVWYSSPDF